MSCPTLVTLNRYWPPIGNRRLRRRFSPSSTVTFGVWASRKSQVVRYSVAPEFNLRESRQQVVTRLKRIHGKHHQAPVPRQSFGVRLGRVQLPQHDNGGLITMNLQSAGQPTKRPWWRPNRRELCWFGAGVSTMIAVAVAIAPPTPTHDESTEEAAPAAVQSPAAAPAPAAVSPTIPMPDLIGRSYSAGSAQIAALGIFAQVDLRDNAPFTGCTDTPTSSLPIVRTDPVAGTPLRRDGETVTLFIDRSAGTPCKPTPPPAAPPPPPPPGTTTYIDPPNVNAPNVNLPNLNPCRNTRLC